MIQLQLQLQYITIFIPISSCSNTFSTHFFQSGAQLTSSYGGRWGVWVDSNPCWTDDQSCTLTTRLRNYNSMLMDPPPHPPASLISTRIYASISKSNVTSRGQKKTFAAYYIVQKKFHSVRAYFEKCPSNKILFFPQQR